MKTIENFDDLLIHIGTGRWNALYFLANSFMYFMWAIQGLSFVYMAPALDYTCLPPDNATSVSEDSCTYVGITEHGAEVQEPCTEWHFDTSIFSNTLTSEFQLVCSRAYLRATYHSIFSFLSVLCLLWGYLADRYGRKVVVVLTHVPLGVLYIAMSFLPTFSMVLAFRALMGALTNATLYLLAMEVCEINKRSTVGVLMGLPWALGTMVYGGLGYLIRDWRWLNFAISVPFLFIFVFIYLFDESPRWLLVTGKKEKARRVVQRAARINQVQLPSEEHLLTVLQKTQEPMPNAEEGKMIKTGCTSPKIFSTPIIRRVTIILATCYIITTLVFTGLNVGGSVFSPNPFIYMVMGGLMEIPGYTLSAPIINRWGRKVPLIVSFFVCGACILSTVIIPKDMSWLVLTLVMLGKLTVSGAYMILVVYQAELQPTEVRLQGKGVALVSASLGECIAPYITSLLAVAFPWLPSVLFGVTSLAACFLLAILPETVGEPLPETVEDLDKLWRRKWMSSSNSVEV
ncbi:organic cation transporter protein-like isoform X1 [Scylla paramamosain]|uniref:organic cation transporter protein-like isoform X1 n=1 Tax=Scylla paramamosain TaxID=85552 RepID=UPI003083B28B